MIPQLPTDNLYKFLALAGLLCCGFSIWAGERLNNSIANDEAIAKKQYIAFMGEMEAMVNEMAASVKSKEPLDVSLEMPHEGKLFPIRPGTTYPMLRRGEDRNDYREVLAFWDKWLLSALPHNRGERNAENGGWEADPTRIRALRNDLREHGFTVENLWKRWDDEMLFRDLATIGPYVGAGASILGFILWYLFVQRYQDALIRLQLDREQRGKLNIS
jgi:hypothetical protein